MRDDPVEVLERQPVGLERDDRVIGQVLTATLNISLPFICILSSFCAWTSGVTSMFEPPATMWK